MDPSSEPAALLTELLDSLSIRAVHLSESIFRGDCGIIFPDVFLGTCLHQVLEGEIIFDHPGRSAQVFSPGDVAWVINAAGHTGQTAPGASLTPLRQTTHHLGPGVGKQVLIGEGAVKARIFTSLLSWASPELHPLLTLLPPVWVLRAAEQDTDLRALLRLMDRERQTAAPGANIAAARLTELVWIHMVRRASQTPLPEPGLLNGLAAPGLARVLLAISENPSHSWTLEQLARTAGMSRTRFAQHFRTRVGLTPFNYIRRWRVHTAQRLLRENDLGLDAIAERVGYASSVSFSRSFAAVTGMPPGQWRLAARK